MFYYINRIKFKLFYLSLTLFIMYSIVKLNNFIITRYFLLKKIINDGDYIFSHNDFFIIKNTFSWSQEHIDKIKYSKDFIHYNTICSSNLTENNLFYYLNKIDLIYLLFFDLIFILFFVFVLGGLYNKRNWHTVSFCVQYMKYL